MTTSTDAERANDYLRDQLHERTKGLPQYITQLLYQISAADAIAFLDEHEAKLRGLGDDELTDIELTIIKQLNISKQAYLKAKNTPQAADALIARLNAEAATASAKREGQPQ